MIVIMTTVYLVVMVIMMVVVVMETRFSLFALIFLTFEMKGLKNLEVNTPFHDIRRCNDLRVFVDQPSLSPLKNLLDVDK